MLLALALLIQDPTDAILADLAKSDDAARQKAVEAAGKLDEKTRKALAAKLLKPAQEAAKDADGAKQKIIGDLLAKRPDEKSLKKRLTEIKQIEDKIGFPMTEKGQKLQPDLRMKLQALWFEQYPELGGVMDKDDVRAALAKLVSIEQAADACGVKETADRVKKVRESLALDEHQQWKTLLPDAAFKTLVKNEEIFKKAKGEQVMKECEYRCSITMNFYRVLKGYGALQLDPALSAQCRKWSAFIDGGGKGGAYGVHSDSPNEDMGQCGEQGEAAAWIIMASDRDHIGAVFRWGSFGIGQHGRWWTWRG